MNQSIVKKMIIFSVLSFSLQALASQQFTFGRYNSRAIFTPSPHCNAPIVIMQTGSGANGPEEMMPGIMTGDGFDHSLFSEFSEGLTRGGVATLAIGKPGIEFFKSWEAKDLFYDKQMYKDLAWQGLIDNVFDAVTFVKTLPCVDPQRIYLFGHSEGTQVAVDYAHQHSDVKGLILLGYSGEPFAETVDWQLFRRQNDVFLSPDVDVNHDANITLDEAKPWPEFVWNWLPGQTQISLQDVEATLRAVPELQQEVQKLETLKLWQGIFHRPAIYKETAELSQDVFIFTGSEDIQTRPEEALRAQDQCQLVGKTNCFVKIVPGLGHAMSQPKGPRKHKLLNSTLGPVDESFKSVLGNLTKGF